MELRRFRHLWGVADPLPIALERIAAAGYAGIETILPSVPEADAFSTLLHRYGLKYFTLIQTSGVTVNDHVHSLRQQLGRAVSLGACAVNVHGGRDAFSFAEAVAFLSEAIAMQRDLPMAVGHETHRGRCLFNPWVTRDLMDRLPELKLVCDYSHWVCVAERLLEDCDTILRCAAARCVHVHARVGYEEGPQVPHPAAPEFLAHLKAHERWWRMIWDCQRARGDAFTSVTPEYGPPSYLQTLPYTQQPVADLWAVCEWMSARLQSTFAEQCR